MRDATNVMTTLAVAPERQARPFRLLVISSDTFPPTRVDVSVLFGEELAARGHRIDWLLQSEMHCERAYTIPWGGGTAWVGATDLRSSMASRIRKHASGILHDFKVFSLLRGDYDLVEVKDKFVSGLFAVLAARLFKKRFVYWLSYPFPEDYLLRASEPDAHHPLLYRLRGLVFKFLLYRILLPAADHVFVQSEQMRRDVATEGIPMDKMTAVPMGIKVQQFMAFSLHEKRQLIPDNQPCFLYLGTFRKVRRLDFLVRVLAEVRKTLPAVKLYIVGSGDDVNDEQDLIAEAVRLGVRDALVLTGQLPQTEALRYALEADVCVSPFYPTPVLNSTSPTKLVEYMAMGKPVVANDHPEQRLLIEESKGGYCVPYEEAAFAAAIVSLLQNPAAARLMGENGRCYVLEHRGYKKIADAVEIKFLQLAGAKVSK